MHLCVGVGTACDLRAAHPCPADEREDLFEGLPEVGTHEGVDHRVDGGVSVGHAVRPDLDLVGVIVALEAGDEGLEEDEELHRPPADSEEDHNDGHHMGDFGPRGLRALGQPLHLQRERDGGRGQSVL